MKSRELQNLGIAMGAPMKAAQAALAAAARAGLGAQAIRERVRAVAADPGAFTSDSLFGELARELTSHVPEPSIAPRSEPAKWKTWGTGLEAEAIKQMANACRLPVAAAGALMPDAHVGYGLPIGGVLATEGAVVPYAVGVDIACRMRMTVVDLPASLLETEEGRARLTKAIESETRFGVGAEFARRREHAVMDEDWSITGVTSRNKDKAWNQLGTSGSGNHFVEFGTLTLEKPDVGLEPGTYLALLSHSGSRGSGAAVCDYYSKLAMSLREGLPPELKYLAWLDLDSEPGQEYWHAMELMGKYAAANHECIHRHVVKHLGAGVRLAVENHHNFAWKERHDPGDGRGSRELIVHRKGATPAGAGVLGVIPGSMAAPGFLVRGKGSAESLHSASHGAGRAMSRTKAKESFAWGNVNRELKARNVHLISAGLDEVPGAYKDIHQVMAQQQDLVEVVARFDPRLVKMAPAGEKAED